MKSTVKTENIDGCIMIGFIFERNPGKMLQREDKPEEGHGSRIHITMRWHQSCVECSAATLPDSS